MRSLKLLFDPLESITTFDWPLQETIVHDLENVVAAKSPGRVPHSFACFSLFKCYLTGFGANYDPMKACHYLLLATESDDNATEVQLARAWCWRIHAAFGITLDVARPTLLEWMQLAIGRGHRKCITEAHDIIELLEDADERARWRVGVANHVKALKTLCGGIGMPYFTRSAMLKLFNPVNMDILDQQIQAISNLDSINSIYVNKRGDGLLHLAAGLGELAALKHLVTTYKPNIDLPNQGTYETPLFSACRAGHFDCAVYLLENGAHGDGYKLAHFTPIFWLCSFAQPDIPVIAQKLVAAGASLKRDKSKTLPHERDVPPSDSDLLLTLAASPLSRAVMMQSMPAVKALLDLGADPLEDIASMSSICPVVMAAVLTLPAILNVLLSNVDQKISSSVGILSDMESLMLASNRSIGNRDFTSLESRLVRCGPDFKSAMFETLKILRTRELHVERWLIDRKAIRHLARDTVLGEMVELGREDIVDSLLRLGHSPHGIPDACPIVRAVKNNCVSIFHQLVDYGADVHTKVQGVPGSPSWLLQSLSLLQFFATRPSYTSPDLTIAEHLLKAGVPVDPISEMSPSAFAFAVQNQRFALADLLLAHGADVNVARPTTVLCELVRDPTERGVESIKYLLRIDSYANDTLPATFTNEQASRVRNRPLPYFIVDKFWGRSVLQQAAVRAPSAGPESHAMTRMLAYILSKPEYSSENAINYQHGPNAAGTALWHAATTLNLCVVTALLDRKADPNIPFQGTTSTPLQAAKEALERCKPDGRDYEVMKERYNLIVRFLVKAGAKEIGQTSSVSQLLTIPGQ